MLSLHNWSLQQKSLAVVWGGLVVALIVCALQGPLSVPRTVPSRQVSSTQMKPLITATPSTEAPFHPRIPTQVRMAAGS